MTIAFTAPTDGAVSLKTAQKRDAAEKTLFLRGFVALLWQ
jgi:hypothetical protein